MESAAPGATGGEAITAGSTTGLPSLCRVGRRVLTLPDESTIDSALPIAVPVLGSSVMINAEPGADHVGRSTIATLVTRLAATVPAGRLEFAVFDPLRLGGSLGPVQEISRLAPGLFGGGIRHQSSELERDLADLLHLVTSRNQRMGGELADLLSVERSGRSASEDEGPSYVVLVAFDHPHGWSRRAAELLAPLMSAGSRAGISCILQTSAPPDVPVAGASFRSEHLLVSAAEELLEPETGAVIGALDPAPTTEQCAQLGERLATLLAPAVDQVMPIDTLVRRPATPSTGLTIPIATRLGETVEITFGSDGVAPVHGLLIGGTGAGKSRLMHAIAHAVAARYDQDTARLILVDMKAGGVEFARYDLPHGQLPHVQVLAIESDRHFAVSVLEYLTDEMARRGATFRTHGVVDIDGYRAAGETLPRLLVIIDEFQRMFSAPDGLAEEAADHLDRLHAPRQNRRDPPAAWFAVVERPARPRDAQGRDPWADSTPPCLGVHPRRLGARDRQPCRRRPRPRGASDPD